MESIDLGRRSALQRMLALAGIVTIGGCSRTPHRAFRALYATPSGARVAFDYWDSRHYRFTPVNGGIDTWVVDATIYLVIAPSLAFANRGTLHRVGPAAPLPRANSSVKAELRSSVLPAATVAAWALNTPVYDIAVAGIAPGIAHDITVAELPALAHAQFVADQCMRSAMDMTLCSASISQLLAAWPAHVTGQGFAALASSAGVHLIEPLSELREPLRLPQDYEFQDLGRFLGG